MSLFAIEWLRSCICIHGDGKHAVEFAKTINEGLLKHNIKISSDEQNI